MKQIITHFDKNDPILAPIVRGALAHSSPIRLRRAAKPSRYFNDLAESIMSQQLSVKAADTIWKRLVELVGGKVTPDSLLGQNVASLRKVGASNAKASYLLAMADDVKSGRIKLGRLSQLDDKEVVEELIKLKGVGPWTAEMFLMFTLGRPDVFSYLDLGLIRAFETAYKVKSPARESMEPIVAKWSPYRTYAALALWHSRDNRPL